MFQDATQETVCETCNTPAPDAEKASKNSRRILETDSRHRIMNSPLHHSRVGRSGKPNSTKEEGADNNLSSRDKCVRMCTLCPLLILT